MSTKIEWTQETWNPIVGCSHVSPGCDNCYAEQMAKRLVAMGHSKYSAVLGDDGRWNGRTAVAEKMTMTAPLRWKKPRRIFVDSMSDLFHESVASKDIQRVFEIGWQCRKENKDHTFMFLTKRPERMNEEYHIWLSGKNTSGGAGYHWFGVTVENQATADERIPILLNIPAAVRFVSCEPLLGATRLIMAHRTCPRCSISHYSRNPTGKGFVYKEVYCPKCGYAYQLSTDLDWVICGGESGPGARPMRPDWARSLRDQCAATDVPFFFKQWGDGLKDELHSIVAGRDPNARKGGRMLDGRLHDEYPTARLKEQSDEA